MKNTKSLRLKWTVSRGQNTYGYNVCTLYVDGVKYTSCNGGGYDMEGTVLAEYIKDTYLDRIKALEGNSGSLDKTGTGYYSIMFHNEADGWHKHYKEGDRVSFDGACGVSEVKRIAQAIGLDLEYSHGFSDKKQTAYYLTDTLV